jgi:hypothetical protein
MFNKNIRQAVRNILLNKGINRWSIKPKSLPRFDRAYG